MVAPEVPNRPTDPAFWGSALFVANKARCWVELDLRISFSR
jgi:hypothetical protein